MGDAILQKTYTIDFLTKKRVLNNGYVKKYYVRNSHEAIISIAQKRMDEWIKKQGGFDDSNLTTIDYMTDDERTEFHLLNLALSLGVNTQKEAQQKVQERLATRRGKMASPTLRASNLK